MSEELDKLIAQLKEKRGTPEQWLERSMAVTRFLADLSDSTRVFCRGEVHLDNGHFPAVLAYDVTRNAVAAWAASGENGEIEASDARFFRSGIPHASIAREVLAGTETQTLPTSQRDPA